MRCDDLSARATLLGVVGWPPCPAVLMAQGIPLQRAPRHGRRPPTAAPSRCFAAATGGSCRPIATHASSRAPAHYNSNTAASLPLLAVDASCSPARPDSMKVVCAASPPPRRSLQNVHV